MNVRQPETRIEEQSELARIGAENGGIMKKVYVSTLMVILFSTVVVSFSYAQGGCCSPGSGCCGTPNIAGVQQQPRASSGGPSQAKVGTRTSLRLKLILCPGRPRLIKSETYSGCSLPLQRDFPARLLPWTKCRRCCGARPSQH